MIESLYEQLQKHPLLLTTEKFWGAYARAQPVNTKGPDQKCQLTDIIALVKFAIGLDNELKPFAEQADGKFEHLISHQNAQRAPAFTPEQTEWLRLIKEHIAASAGIEREDFDYSPFSDKGGLQKAWGLFDNELDSIMSELNRELVA